MASTTDAPVGKIIKGRHFQIPNYQRGYSWQDKQVRDFQGDIDYLLESNDDMEHYFGTIVIDTDSYDDYVSVIDGQQRLTTLTLLFKVIDTEFDYLQNILDNSDSNITGSVDVDSLVQEINQEQKYWWEDYVRYRKKWRLNPDDFQSEFYNKILCRKSSTPARSSAETFSQYNLINAFKSLKNWLVDKRNREKSESQGLEWVREYKKTLEEIKYLIDEKFKVILYNAEPEQAGRMFGLLNDRGRGLNLADKVKSHMVYQASRIDSDLEDLNSVFENMTSEGSEEDYSLVEYVQRVFNETLAEITNEDVSDSDINEFMKTHWRLFTGEWRLAEFDTVTDMHRRVKQIERHIPHNRDDQEKWISAYLKSLYESARVYKWIQNPEKLIRESRSEDVQTIGKRLYIITEFGSSSLQALTTSILKNHTEKPLPESDREAVSNQDKIDDILDILSRLEVFTIRGYQVSKCGTNIFRNKSRKLAYDIEWADNWDWCDSVFNNDRMPSSDNLSEPTLPEAVSEVKQSISGYARNNGGDFADKLQSDDVIEGRFTEDWTGVNEDVIRYILFEYENNLQENNHEFEKYISCKSKEYTIEHIHPIEPDGEDPCDNHDRLIGALGNLAILSFEENRGAWDKKYSDKLSDVYQSSDTKMVNRLSKYSEHEWTEEQVAERREDIIDFCKSRWAV